MKSKLVFLAGIFLLVLPVGLKFWGNHRQETVISTYEKEVEKIDTGELELAIENACTYNEKLYLSDEFCEEEYEKQLNIFNNGIIGSVEIPKIDLKLPIYHGTEEEILTNGIGHLKESSLPVPGEASHSILTGHRGLPDAEMFTRLDEIDEGDVFYVNICNHRFAYRVCDIQVVRPEDVEILEIQPGRSLISLITCTPYGINTHRLVVTGENYEETEPEAIEVKQIADRDILFISIPIIILIVAIWSHVRKRGQ